MSEDRVRLDYVCRVTGMRLRQAQQMAKRGEIPSAAQFGRLWTFDKKRVDEWKRAKEKGTWQTTSTAEEKSGGVAFSPPGKNYDEACERHLRLRPRSGSPSGRRISTTPDTTARRG